MQELGLTCSEVGLNGIIHFILFEVYAAEVIFGSEYKDPTKSKWNQMNFDWRLLAVTFPTFFQNKWDLK